MKSPIIYILVTPLLANKQCISTILSLRNPERSTPTIFAQLANNPDISPSSNVKSLVNYIIKDVSLYLLNKSYNPVY